METSLENLSNSDLDLAIKALIVCPTLFKHINYCAPHKQELGHDDSNTIGAIISYGVFGINNGNDKLCARMGS